MKHFDFGKNWISFSDKGLTPERIDASRYDFTALMGNQSLQGKSFLDIGFGQGLALLIAREQGATVVGCDINEKCRDALDSTSRHFGKEAPASIVTGSILDSDTITRIRAHAPPGFDIVHSWGVLHHTGNMRKAIEHACSLTIPGGTLILAIYNKHWSSIYWRMIKYLYCHSPSIMQRFLIALFFPIISFAKFLVTRSNPFHQQRGMHFLYDLIDWIGGYPYEYASAAEVTSIVSPYGFTRITLIPAKVPTGCNQFVFKKSATS